MPGLSSPILRYRRLPALTAALLAVWPSAAHAELPEGARAMIDEAIATGDAAQVKVVIALARKISPEDSALLDQIAEDFAKTQGKLAAQNKAAPQTEALAKNTASQAAAPPKSTPTPMPKPANAAKLAANMATPAKASAPAQSSAPAPQIVQAAASAAKPQSPPKPAPPPPPQEDFFDHWSGRGELGAFRNTGNSSNTGISAALNLKRAGRVWSTRLQASLDYQRSGGETNRERYLLLAEPQYAIGDEGFIFGLSQWDRDRFRGIGSRTALSAGLGYKPIANPDMHLDIKFGPTWRKTHYVLPDDSTETVVAALFASNFDWKISETVILTQDMNAYLGSDNNSYSALTALEIVLSSKLRTKLSYLVEHDSNPPGLAKNTDTLSRFSLIYGF